MAGFTGPRAHEVGHQEADLGGGEELAGALAGAFRELAQQVLVGAAQEVGLHVGEAEAVAGVGEGFDDGGEPSRVDVALAVAFGGEVHHVDHAGQRWVVTDDGADGPGQVLANVVRAGAVPLAVKRPSVRLAAAEDGPARFRRQVEAQQLVVAFGNLLRRGAVAVFLGEAGDFVVEDV